jgi:hypothetical protein
MFSTAGIEASSRRSKLSAISSQSSAKKGRIVRSDEAPLRFLMNKVFQAVVLALVVGMYLALPLMTIWGWMRWAGRSQPRTSSSILSLIGFIFSTASVVLAISSLVYAHVIGGFRSTIRFCCESIGLGLGFPYWASFFSLIGVWRPSPLRWHAGLCSTGTLLFWFFSAMGE